MGRPAVRVLCVDGAGRLLLLRWRDPHDGHIVWEPPGGGIDDGEGPLEAARRELTEETGLDPAAIGVEHVTVDRDTWWNGKRHIGAEEFFLARYPGPEPAVARDGLLDYEQDTLTGHAWVHLDELGGLDGIVDPPGLPGILEKLTGQ